MFILWEAVYDVTYQYPSKTADPLKCFSVYWILCDVMK